jgi:hypothetical protein
MSRGKKNLRPGGKKFTSTKSRGSGGDFPKPLPMQFPPAPPTRQDWIRVYLTGAILLVWIVFLAVLAVFTGRWG